MRPLQFAIYKGTGGSWGAAQFSLQPPHYYRENPKQRDFTGLDALDDGGKLKEGWKIREGAVFLQQTSTKEGQKNVYDWDAKVVMALSVEDMGKLALACTTGESTKIFHDPGAKTAAQGAVIKSLTINSPEGVRKGVVLSIIQKAGGTTTKHDVPVSGAEAIVLTQLLRSAISRSLNW